MFRCFCDVKVPGREPSVLPIAAAFMPCPTGSVSQSVRTQSSASHMHTPTLLYACIPAGFVVSIPVLVQWQW